MPMSPSTSSPAPEVAHTDSNHSNDDHSIDEDNVVVGPPSKKVKTEDEQTSDSPSQGNERRINNEKNDDDDDQQTQQQTQQQQQRQQNQQHQEEEDNSSVDSEEDINLEEVEPDLDEDSLFQRILAAAAAQGIPLEYLAARGLSLPLGFGGIGGVDDTPVVYPFDDPPTSIEDVANFIQSEKCQRIMVLAG
jgi:hypothetical protein